MRLTHIEHVIREDPSVHSAKVMTRRTPDGRAWAIAYVVPAGPVDPATFRHRLRDRLANGDHLDEVVLLPSVPRDVDGHWDHAALEAIPVVDDTVLLEIEERLFAANGGKQVAALPESREPSTNALDLSLFQMPQSAERRSRDMGRSIDAREATDSETPSARSSERNAIADGGPLHLADAPATLAACLDRACSNHDPDALIVHRADGTSATASYRDLSNRALDLLSGLQSRNVPPGTPVVLACHGQMAIIEAFWACQLGGLVPVPVAPAPTYREMNAGVRRIYDVLAALPPATLLLSDDPTIFGLNIDAERVVCVDGLVGNDLPRLHVPRPEDTALIMMTSGSTGTPKGVPLTHANLIARSVASQQMNGFDRNTVSLNWMPFDHVAAMIYFHIRDVYLGCQQVHIDGATILAAPLRWLDFIEQYRATVTFAPNFAFGRICELAEQIARGRWDLTSLRQVLNGGEAVVASTARQFLKLLAPHGLRPDAMVPAWGMSETSSGITYNFDFRLESTTDADPYVSVGAPIPGDALRVVDEADRVLKEGQVGRLQAKGLTIFDGYYGQDAADKADCFTEDGWFRTGDLARIENGSVTITGREKDVIIVGGVNYPCAMIERAVEDVPGVERSFTAACSVPDPRPEAGECLAIFLNTQLTDQSALATLFRTVKQRTVEQTGLTPTFIVPVEQDAVPKTSIGKIQRRILQDRFVAGDFLDAVVRVNALIDGDHKLPNWFFRPVWTPAALPSNEELRPDDGAVLIFGNGPLAALVRNRLEDKGIAAVSVTAGSSFSGKGTGPYRLRADSLEDFRRLYEAIEEKKSRVRRILHLWNIPGEGPETPSDLAAGEVARWFTACMLQFLKATREFATQTSGLGAIVVSRGGRSVRNGEGVDISTAPADALVTSAAQEPMGVDLRCVDIVAANDDEVANIIEKELWARADARDAAYRDGKRYLPALRQPALRDVKNARPVVTPGGCYLVAGGLGAIGFHLVAHLLQSFHARVLIVGRSVLPTHEKRDSIAATAAEKELIARIAELETLPGKVAYISADITDADALSAAVEEGLRSVGDRLDGVFHVAGAYHRRLLADETEADLDEILRPKIDGTLALASLIEGNANAPFVIFSSQVALAGAATMSAYAAANHFQDMFVQNRCAKGLPYYSLNWTEWHGMGISADQSAGAALQAMGLCSLSPRQGIRSLDVAMLQEPGQIVIGLDPDSQFVRRQLDVFRHCQGVGVHYEASGDTKANDIADIVVKDRFGVVVPLFFHATASLPRTSDNRIDRDQLARRLREAVGSDEQPANDEERLVAGVWYRLLGRDGIGVDANLFELGAQSILATRLAASLTEASGVAVSLRDIFEAPTIRGQAARIRNGAANSSRPESREEPPSEVDEVAGLLSAQRRSWFLERVDPGNPAYHIMAGVRFDFEPDLARVEQALNVLLRRHSGLRATFPARDGVPFQRILERMPVKLEPEELDGSETLDDFARKEGLVPFDLAKGPLVRFRLVRFAKNAHMLFLTFHHIITDAWSMRILFREFAELYRQGPNAPLPEEAIEYTDLVGWQQSTLTDDSRSAQIAFWRRHLEGNLKGFELPTDYPRPATRRQRGSRYSRRLSDANVAELDTLAKQRGLTRYIILFAAFKALLHRYSQSDDIVVGTPIANRDDPRVAHTVGFLVNMLTQRTDLSGDPSFAELLTRVQTATLEAYRSHTLPFEDLVDALSLDRDTSRTPLFQICFDFHDREIAASPIPGVSFEVVERDLGACQFDLYLSIRERTDGLDAVWEFDTDLFGRDTIQRMAANFGEILRSALAAPETPLSQLSLIAPEEAALLAKCHTNSHRFRDTGSFHELFEAHVDRQPDAPAVSFGGVVLSYAELDARANRLARRLRALGVGRDQIVGVSLRRGLDLPVAIFAVLKAGGAFLPLDPAYPTERLNFMISDAGCRLLITSSDLRHDWPSNVSRCIDLDRENLESWSADPPNAGVAPNDLAYIIYTSGSTGRPKGVMVEHGGLCNFGLAMEHKFGFGPSTRVLQFASISFDAHVLEYAMAFPGGGTLYLATDDEVIPGPALSTFIHANRINALLLPPTVLRAMRPDDVPELEFVSVGGEACPKSVVDDWATEGRRFYNFYGPTEATICASYAQCRAHEGERPAIGEPVANVRLYVLDRHRRPLPIGIPGELYIGGAGVARGYLGREQLTSESFLRDPFAGRSSARMYKTGDLVKWRSDGQLDFLGRLDHQIKLRGFRIELGEIESVLETHPGIAAAAVIVRKDLAGDDMLVAYVEPRMPNALDVDSVRRHVQDLLPTHMVPGAFVTLSSLPMTANRKIDRAALPDQNEVYRLTAVSGAPPRTELETKIATVWQEILNVPAVGTDKNFFEVGGHSLKLAQVQTRLHRELERSIPMVKLFQHPTIRSLAAYLSDTEAPEERLPEEVQKQTSAARDRLNQLAALRRRSNSDRTP